MFAPFVTYNPEIVEIYGSESDVSNAVSASGSFDVVNNFENGTFESSNVQILESSSLRYDIDSNKFYNLKSSNEELNGSGITNNDVEPNMIYVFEYNVLLMFFAFIITTCGFIFIGILKGKEVMALAFSFIVGPITLASSIIDKGASFQKWINTTIKMAINIWISFLSIYVGVQIFAMIIDSLGNLNNPFSLMLGTIMLLGSLIFFILDGPKILNDVWQMDGGASNGSMAAITNRTLASGGNKLSSLGNKVSSTAKSGVKGAVANEKSWANTKNDAVARGKKSKVKNQMEDNPPSNNSLKKSGEKDEQLGTKISSVDKKAGSNNKVVDKQKGNDTSIVKNGNSLKPTNATVEKPLMENGYPIPAVSETNSNERGKKASEYNKVGSNSDINTASKRSESTVISNNQTPNEDMSSNDSNPVKSNLDNNGGKISSKNKNPVDNKQKDSKTVKINSNRGKRSQSPSQKRTSKEYMSKTQNNNQSTKIKRGKNT